MGLVLLACAARPTEAQAPRRPLRIWAAGGTGGAAGADDAGGVGALVQLAAQKAPHQVTLRGLLALDPWSDGTSTGVGELGLLYGRTATAPFGHVSLSTGLAMVGFDICQPAGSSCQTVGVPVVAEAAFQPFDILGVGVQAFGNINSKTSYLGAMLFLQLGWMP